MIPDWGPCRTTWCMLPSDGSDSLSCPLAPLPSFAEGPPSSCRGCLPQAWVAAAWFRSTAAHTIGYGFDFGEKVRVRPTHFFNQGHFFWRGPIVAPGLRNLPHQDCDPKGAWTPCPGPPCECVHVREHCFSFHTWKCGEVAWWMNAPILMSAHESTFTYIFTYFFA